MSLIGFEAENTVLVFPCFPGELILLSFQSLHGCGPCSHHIRLALQPYIIIDRETFCLYGW